MQRTVSHLVMPGNCLEWPDVFFSISFLFGDLSQKGDCRPEISVSQCNTVLSEVNNPATNLIENLFFVCLPVMETDSLLNERGEKMKCRGTEKKADCLGIKGE